jgi:hypothetical protein
MATAARTAVCAIALLSAVCLGQNCPTRIEYKNGSVVKLDCNDKEVGKTELADLKDIKDIKVEPPNDSVLTGSPEDPSLKSKRTEWDVEYISYQIWALKHTRSIFFWQHVTTQVIAMVVLAMVLAGFYFASVQFQIAKAHSSDAKQETTHEMKLSLEGLSVKTSALGVVILVVSMAFFFLYLRYVYPIQPLSSGPDSTTANEK